ncbi:cytochrome P450 2G1-like [Discoglossus pictus]
MRSFALWTFRNIGLGKKSTEGKIQEEAEMMVKEIRKSEGSSLDPSKPIMDAISNILCCVMFGNRFDYKDEKLKKLITAGDDINHIMTSTWGQVEVSLPGRMKYIPGPHKRIYSVSDELVEFINERVKMNQGTLDPNFPRDYLDCFLIKMEQEKQNPKTEFTMRNLLMSVQDLFIAGIDTISSTIYHSLQILATFSEIQAKVHEEIDQVIGRDRMPRMDDRSSMPYTDAVMNETQRFADIAPFNVTHSVTRDTQFRGYSIPKLTK